MLILTVFLITVSFRTDSYLSTPLLIYHSLASFACHTLQLTLLDVSLSNIWLAGRYFESSDKNSSSFFWLKGYDKLPVLTYFWNDSNLPTAYSNNGTISSKLDWQVHVTRFDLMLLIADACLSVSSATEYTDWVVDHCQEKRNYFVCEKEEPVVVEPTGYYNYQCRCKPGYHGFNCEMRLQNSYMCNWNLLCDKTYLCVYVT